jgi:hypothetical protein
MVYIPTDWKDRVVEKPRTYTLVDNGDGTVTLTPAPGTVVQEGTPVNAANLGNLETQYGLAKSALDAALHGATGHAHTGEAGEGPVLPGWKLIDETVLESDAASVSWSSLAEHWKAFRVDTCARATSTSIRDLLIRFNNNATSIYGWHRLQMTTSAAYTRTPNTSEILLWQALTRFDYTPQSVLGVEIGNIYNAYKPVRAHYVQGLEGTLDVHVLMAGHWRNSAAYISRIDLVASGDKIKAGSIFRLWGLRA